MIKKLNQIIIKIKELKLFDESPSLVDYKESRNGIIRMSSIMTIIFLNKKYGQPYTNNIISKIPKKPEYNLNNSIILGKKS